jgi:hypothetical protein
MLRRSSPARFARSSSSSDGRDEAREPGPARRAQALSKTFQKHVERALVALEELSIRELEATADTLRRPRHGLQSFGRVFSAVASKRDGATWTSPASDLRAAIVGVDDLTKEIIADAPHPFWQAVRKAVEAIQRRGDSSSRRREVSTSIY